MAAIGVRRSVAVGDLGWAAPRRRGLARPRSSEGIRPRRARIHRRRAAGLSLALVVILAAALLAALYLTQSSRIAGTGYEIDTLEAQLDQLEAQRQELLFQIGRAQAPATIQARAAGLGLIPLPEASVQFARPLSDRHD